MKTAQQVYDGLVAYLRGFSNPASAWYAGIAADPKERLFVEHGVDEGNGQWAYDTCSTADDARAVEAALIKRGCKGGGGGGDNATKCCYVYYMTNSTRE